MNTQDTPNYGATVTKGNTVESAQQTVARTSPILDAARGYANLGISGSTGVQTIATYPTIDPVTGEPDAEPVRPPDYFRLGDVLGSKPLRP